MITKPTSRVAFWLLLRPFQKSIGQQARPKKERDKKLDVGKMIESRAYSNTRQCRQDFNLYHVSHWHENRLSLSCVSPPFIFTSKFRNKMRAVLIKDGEGPVENLYIGEAPKPTLGNGEVLIKESLNDSYWKT